MAFDFREVGARVSNWGRWGAADERGTLNLVTPEAVVAAKSAIVDGRTFELSIPISGDGPRTDRGRGNRVNPIHLMNIVPGDLTTPDGAIVADDYIVMPLQSGTQWDGLAHVGYDGYFYNNVPVSAVSALDGARRNAIDSTLPGMVGRGVLLDVARDLGRDWLEPGHAITPADLDRVAARQGVELRSGDALLVRTGWRRRALDEGWSGWLGDEPGLAAECAPWLHERNVAVLACDNWGVEVQPADDGWLPLHCVLIRDMGMPLGEMFDLEALAADCAEDGRWEFFFSAPALRVKGGAGSPVSPIAVK